LGTIDGAHATFAEFGDDGIVVDGLADQMRRAPPLRAYVREVQNAKSTGVREID
jgi:hypothetical protein